MNHAFCVVLVTIPAKEAKPLINKILSVKCAACVNVLPAVRSHYWWKKRIETAKESLLLIKTRKMLLKKLFTVIRENHSYQVPEIIVLPVIDGHRPYLDWLHRETEL